MWHLVRKNYAGSFAGQLDHRPEKRGPVCLRVELEHNDTRHVRRSYSPLSAECLRGQNFERAPIKYALAFVSESGRVGELESLLISMLTTSAASTKSKGGFSGCTSSPQGSLSACAETPHIDVQSTYTSNGSCGNIMMETEILNRELS